MNIDPRPTVIEDRLKGVHRVIAVSGGKGGTGKSSVSSLLALILSGLNYRVGLLDLDFSGPSDHVILGTPDANPREEYGIIPPEVYGIDFMSIVHYAGEDPLPLRGADVSNALIEFLTITRWGTLDFLIIDMPPGIGDATLDTIRLIKNLEILVVVTPSKVALAVVGRMLKMLKGLDVPVLGVIENMNTPASSFVKEEIEALGVQYLGEIGFDEAFEDAVGDVDKLTSTAFIEDLKEIVSAALKI